MKQRNKPKPAAVFGIDIGKNIFHVVGVQAIGKPVQKVRFKRDTLLQFFERAEPSLIGMESCPVPAVVSASPYHQPMTVGI